MFLKSGAHQYDYYHRTENFRAMKLIVLMGILERKLFLISSLHFRAMMQNDE